MAPRHTQLLIDSLKGQVLAISDWNREMIGWQHPPRQLNANGTLWLAADGQDLVITSTNKDQELYLRIAHKGSAIWSPTDPSLFATIGDADSNDSLCLWQIAGES